METQETTQPCPYCGEQIKVGAKKCRYCNEWLEEPPIGYLASKEQSSSSGNSAQKNEQGNSELNKKSKSQTTKKTSTSPQNQIVTVQYQAPKQNEVGIVGFILAILSLFVSWTPVVNWIAWFLGALLSFIGLFYRPRGLAIAGFLISLIDVIIIVAIVGTVAGALSSLSSIF